jgi:integrase
LRRYTIGQYGSPWSPDQAREQALQYLSQLARGVDPTAEKRARKAQGWFADLISQYLDEAMQHKKPKTRALEEALIKRHIVPLLGKKKAVDISRRDLQKFMIDVESGKTAVDVKTRDRGRAIVRGGKGVANRALDLLSSIFTFAIELGVRTDNPTKGVKKYTLKRHDRYLNKDELERLGSALVDAEADGFSQFAIAAIRFMLLSGCRSGEAMNLQWNWIDRDHNLAKLPDSKTGQKVVLLGKGAMALLDDLPRVEGSPLVFPSAVGGTTPISIQKVWRGVRSRAGLDDLRLHDLRHNFASSAVSSGQSLYIVGKLLGHSQTQTTQRYAHLAPDPVRQAADDVSESLAVKIRGKSLSGCD